MSKKVKTFTVQVVYDDNWKEPTPTWMRLCINTDTDIMDDPQVSIVDVKEVKEELLLG